jgi:hypothetical protein
MLVVFVPVPADFVYMYSATCPMLPTQYNIFLPAYPKKGKGYTEEERIERKKDNLFS